VTISSAQRKLSRGIEHVKTLGREASIFEKGNAYVFESEVESASPDCVRYRCYAFEREPVPDHWPLLAGDAIQNLRSALDHVVYAARRGRGKTQFPIFTDPCEFQVIGSKMLPGVPKAMRARIQAAQPYRITPTAPTQDPLAQLNALSNLDKHRALTTVASAVHLEGVGLPEGVDLAWEKYATNSVLGAGKTHISTFVIRAEGKAEDVAVEPQFTYQVRIEGRPLNVLVWIAKIVYRVVTECETGKQLAPFAPYPI
jgi:hypothetical protein